MIGSYFCTQCASEIEGSAQPPICPVCTKPAVGGVVHPYCKTKYTLDGFIGLFRYTGPVRKAIKAIKFRRQTELVDELTNLSIKYLKRNENGFYIPLLNFLTKSKPVLIPIPLHASRKRKRWFNQSELVSRIIADSFNLVVNSDVLIRTRQNIPHAQLKRKDRLLNIKDSFAISNSYCSPSTKNQNLCTNFLLVDDVWTTGATMREAGSVLKRHGTKNVWGLTIAR